jgi:hypothetical protein
VFDVVVQYGKPAFVGRFRADEEYPRGCRVAVRTARGLECGAVLHAGAIAAAVASVPDGEVESLLVGDDPIDDSPARIALAAAERYAPATLWLDAELLLDGSVILHALPANDNDLTPTLEAVGRELERSVRLFDVSRQTVAQDPPTTCGKPDCGTGTGKCTDCGTGCSTGSCSRSAVKNAGELTAYFAGLRRQMETQRTPLV